MWGWNRQVWEKRKRTTKCDKRTVIRDVGTTQCEDKTVKCEKKSNVTTKYDKRTVTCNVGTAQYENEIVKYEKQIREPHNVTKELTYVMLELHNVRMKPSNVRKK